MTQRLFVTGLSGFVGKHLQAYLAAAHTPWALLPVPHRYDLLEPDSLGDLWPELPDAVIHLAGQTYVPEAFRDPARTLQINLLGTLNLLQALKARGFSGTFLYISSGDVYGQVAEAALPIHEELIPHPRNPYAVSKLAAESLCLQWGITEGWRVLVARPFNHIGPGQKDSFVIASAARQIARMKQGLQANRLEVGDIDVSRDFLDVQDVLSAYLRLLSHGEAGAVYNVCSGQEQKIRELIELLADIAQVELEIVQDPARMRRAEQRRVRGSHARLHDSTGWKPEITIKQSLRAILSDWESRVREE
ncbi:GDP-6-deoxy-D-mannose reductase [Pseudomonas aeruginosa]|uniref:GDP-6-deoxy-D-mannose reductase n=1 Tax=Pseudomonas aeruginosa TaxID=287 RepID=UPI0009BB6151|nr:GDP-6-deoxy-D-mannose reductase [Pseudomonas aeruginosa]ARC82775.1 NAD-dependent dehydratase [Pseudomonas aeruginosa]MCO3581828.1 NAD-dependent epimerase/dehydratase family protein [Pseudomonas aeruginosa]MCO3760468.1 NAD-dependent epimerase/dehydratase family protein [Pseudomonas aeruginosa]MCR3819721.1 GDP-6-deoxy-D-mannose reductase [Pseudomonas aeruginosa]MCX5485327.1 GDP-6-deoxy-D-mannose reductase [Pseudomonas aeruginosa]